MKGGERIKEELKIILMTVISTIILIIFSLIYFVLTLFVIKIASDIVFDESVNANWAVLAAAIVTMGSILGGALEKKRGST